MRWNRLTIHHSVSRDVSVDIIRLWHLRRGWSDIGYHFVIRKGGALEAGRPLTRMGAHVKDKNEGNIGVCLTGHFRIHKPSKEQYKTLFTLLYILRFAFNIEEIFLHSELAATRCPGKFFNLDELSGL